MEKTEQKDYRIIDHIIKHMFFCNLKILYRHCILNLVLLCIALPFHESDYSLFHSRPMSGRPEYSPCLYLEQQSFHEKPSLFLTVYPG